MSQITSLCKVLLVALWMLRGEQGQYQGRKVHASGMTAVGSPAKADLKQTPEARIASTYCDDGFFARKLPSTRKGKILQSLKAPMPNKNLCRLPCCGDVNFLLGAGSAARLVKGLQCSDVLWPPGFGRQT